MLGMWMCMLGTWMLFSAVASFQALRDGRPALSAAAAEGEAVARAYHAMSDTYARAHPYVLPAQASAKLVLGLALLWVVATLIAMDRRGRGAAIVAALLSVAYFIGTTVLELLVVRAGAAAATPALAEALARNAGADALGIAELTVFATRFLVMVPLVSGAFGVALSALVLLFFAGRRGRAYYGVEVARGDAG